MRIRFQKLFPYAPYLNEEQDISMDFPDTTDQATYDSYMDTLRTLQENNHKRQYPHLYTEQAPQEAFKVGDPVIPVIQVEKKEPNTIEALKNDIMACGSISSLETWKLVAKSNPDLQKVYDAKMEELKK